ncbi:hypothetical protein MVES_000617 [Malassezia vespertilionis]|uniref:Uncharacterized protein n=1 Tax=Malassezia vespertilionis TaxID=2020962 RepID=A0A2N1JH71_9BASI|nr:hypothetical protein MVES_000617 [Malassezia vespertilionis]
MTARATPETAPPALQIVPLNPPPVFSHVCPHIFRSADPGVLPDAFVFLETLHLRSIVLLSIEYPSKAMKAFAAKNHVQMHHFGIERRWPTPNLTGTVYAQQPMPKTSNLFLSVHEMNSFSVLESIVKDALQLLLDVRNHPVAGIFETGTLIGCLRKMQGWNFASILLEYRGFAGPLSRGANERFIETFDTDLVTLPPTEFIPDWLLPPQQFFVDDVERSDASSTTDSVPSV